MTQSTARPGGDMFPELVGQPVRNFTETGWGRYPLPLLNAGLTPTEFAVMITANVWADTGEAPPPPAELARRIGTSESRTKVAIEALAARQMLKIEGETWTLTDPKTWLPS